jgi:myo-inositol 2-dehydrogenase/D-chiro-inositol 1-dehydrogenase
MRHPLWYARSPAWRYRHRSRASGDPGRVLQPGDRGTCVAAVVAARSFGKFTTSSGRAFTGTEHVTALLRVGLIGCGSIARLVHLGVLMRLNGVELAALAEPDDERRAEAARRAPRASSAARAEELLDMPDVDAVVVCAPNALHAELAVAAFERGKHVYLEKPIAVSVAEACGVVEAWRRSGRTGMVGFNYRYNELHRAAKRLLDTGEIGDVVAVRTVFSSAARPLPDWKQRRASGGGVLLDLASHHIDLIRFLLGAEVFEVTANVDSWRGEADTAWLQLRVRVAGGREVGVQSFFSAGTADDDRIEVYGSAGMLAVDRYHGVGVELTRQAGNGGLLRRLGRGAAALARSPYLRDRLLAPTREPSFRAALSHFAAAARDGRPASPNPWDGYVCLTIIATAEESARTGRPVAVPE